MKTKIILQANKFKNGRKLDNKLIFIALFIIGISVFTAGANAQMMGGFNNTSVDWNEVVEHTAREEQEGKELWDKLQAKETAICACILPVWLDMSNQICYTCSSKLKNVLCCV